MLRRQAARISGRRASALRSGVWMKTDSRGVAEGGDPGEVLRDVDGGFAGATVGFTADHGAGEGWVGCDGDDRGHCLRGRCEVWSGSLGIGLDGSVQQPGDGVETGLARARFEVGYRAEDFAAEIEVEMRVGGGVKGEVLFGAFGSDLGQGFGAFWYWVVPSDDQEMVAGMRERLTSDMLERDLHSG